MIFEISDLDALGRIGFIKINNKKMDTPNLFPVIHPAKNIIDVNELKAMGTQAIFTNAYLLYLNESLRTEALKKGIHKFLDFNGIIATDSGAFQQYMYNEDNIMIESQTIERFQEDIGSDFPVILDVPLQLNDSYEVARIKLNNTITRAKENLIRRTRVESNWFGPIHGGKYLDLLKECCQKMNQLDFAVYAIGGLVKAYMDYRFDLTTTILLTSKKYLAPEKPIHMFGLGLPQYFSLAIACGCDLMDSAAYILYAKEDRYFTLSTGTKKLEELEEFPCNCPICTSYTPKELKESVKSERIKLLAKHNLYISFSELRTIRQAIKDGNLWELLELRIRNHPKLVNALKNLMKNAKYVEVFEKIYKNHGRLYSSTESMFRPEFYRYKSKLNNIYRPPKDVNVMVILPELDLKGDKSPSLSNWLKKIYYDTNDSKKCQVFLFSPIYGLIPEELIDSYPLGQYETISPLSSRVFLDYNSLKMSKQFLMKYLAKYEKIYFLTPAHYFNEFNELCSFPENHPIFRLNSIISKIDASKVKRVNEINDLINELNS